MDSKKPGSIFAGMWWGLKVVWTTCPLITSSLLVLTVLRGIVPAGLALVARGLINGSVEAVQSGGTDLTPLLPWLVLGFGLTLTEGLSAVFNRYGNQRLFDEVNLHVTQSILHHSSTLDLTFFEDHRRRDMIERAQENMASRLTRFLTELLALLTTLFQSVGLVALLVSIEPFILVVLGPFALPYLIFQVRISRRQYEVNYARTTNLRWTRYFISMLTLPRRIPEVRLLGLGSVLLKKFRMLMESFRDRDRQFYRKSAFAGSFFAVLTTASFYALFARVVFRVIEAHLTVGDIAVFGGGTARLRGILERLVIAGGNMTGQALHISDYQRFLDARPDAPVSGGQKISAPRGEIEFRNVMFTYPGSSEPTLKNMSLKILPGETIAIVGENGAGKTTLTKLIAGFYDPDEGDVLFDGVNVKDLDREDLHRNISYVMQRFGKYEATLGENVAYGDWGRLGEKPEEILKAGHDAGMDDLAATLPEGYDTHIGRLFGSAELSEGQWQRVAMARALARNAALWVLDEPASHLDARAEWELFTRFRSMSRGKTTILISHRLNTLGMADRIVVMEEGRVAEQGSHHELLNLKGNYAELFRLQSQLASRSEGQETDGA